MSSSQKQWAGELREGIRHADDLDRLPLSPEERLRNEAVAKAYKVRVPKYYLDLIDWSNPNDPIRAQALPSFEELQWDEGELEDPIGDIARSPVPRLTHRYPDRVLLFPTYHCAIYCRHCFRKESLNDGGGFSREAIEPALLYIAEHTELREVILTGGDPLMISDANLAYIRDRLERIPHLRLLRIHTRIPVVLPARVTPALVAVLKGQRMVCIVMHFNHPREITTEASRACRLFREAGFMLLNQSVLLRGVNDDIGTLRALFQELVYTLGAKPYYLHHCDLTRGLTHFRTTIAEGLELMHQLRGFISGVCVPTYMLDLPGGHGKIPIGPNYVRERNGLSWVFETYDGATRHYTEVVKSESVMSER